MAKLEHKWEPRGFVLLAVSADSHEQEKDALQLLRKVGIRLPAYIKHVQNDEVFINSIDRAWSCAVPALFLYDRSGKRVTLFIGETATSEIERAIGKAL